MAREDYDKYLRLWIRPMKPAKIRELAKRIKLVTGKVDRLKLLCTITAWHHTPFKGGEAKPTLDEVILQIPPELRSKVVAVQMGQALPVSCAYDQNFYPRFAVQAQLYARA